jgi:hypothetical protein
VVQGLGGDWPFLAFSGFFSLKRRYSKSSNPQNLTRLKKSQKYYKFLLTMDYKCNTLNIKICLFLWRIAYEEAAEDIGIGMVGNAGIVV